MTQVKATDPDTSSNIRFKFSESVAYQKQYWKEFDINSVTGQIDMITEPDHERIDIYFVSNQNQITGSLTCLHQYTQVYFCKRSHEEVL